VQFPGNAVLFDLDGTLVDTAADLAGAVNRALKTIKRPPVPIDVVKSMIGGGFPNLVMKALEHTGGPLPEAQLAPFVEKSRDDYEAHVADSSKVYPGVMEALRALSMRGTRMGVCTNKPSGPSKKLLAALGLDKHISVLVGGDSLPVKKPHPKMALETLKRLNATIDNAVLVGDSETDLKLARAAQLPVILVEGGYTDRPVKSLGADLVIRTLAQLPQYLSAPG
jgi:phosphoglycolate phosphatase